MLTFAIATGCQESTPNETQAAQITDDKNSWIAVIPSVPSPASQRAQGQPDDSTLTLALFGNSSLDEGTDENPVSSQTSTETGELAQSTASLGVWLKSDLAAPADRLTLGQQKCWVAPDQSMRLQLKQHAQFRSVLNGSFQGYFVELQEQPSNCSLLVGFIDGQSVSAVSTSTSSNVEGDPAWGAELANSIRRVSQTRAGAAKCPGRSTGQCYWCVGEALKIAIGRDEIIAKGGGDINRAPHYASFFADQWNETKWGPLLGLSRVHYLPPNRRGIFSDLGFPRMQRFAEEAPRGSVIVWSKCGRSAAGHIAIVTNPGTARADFEAPIKDTCGSMFQGYQQIIAVFHPTSKPRRP